MKLSSKILLVLIVVLLPIVPAMAVDENYIGEIIWVDFNHAPSHCYAPAHLYEDGLHRVWFCNWDQRLGKVDAIWYTQKEGDLSNPNGWTKPIQVHNMQMNPSWIANHTADGCNIVADLQSVSHLIGSLLLLILRANQEEVENYDHDDHHNDHGAATLGTSCS